MAVRRKRPKLSEHIILAVGDLVNCCIGVTLTASAYIHGRPPDEAQAVRAHHLRRIMLKPVRAAVMLFTGRHCHDGSSSSNDGGAIVVRCWRGMDSLFTCFVFLMI